MKNFITYPILVLVLFFNKSFFAQYDTIQYLPPIYIANAIKNSASNIKNHFLVLSTVESNSFNVTLKDGSGALFTGYTVQSGTQASPGVLTISRTNPARIKFNGTGVNVHGIVSRSSLNTTLASDGLYFEASKPFFANIRHQANSQAGSLTTKGSSGLGTDFFVGFQNMKNSSSSVNTHESHFFSVMATEDNTAITFTNFKPGTTFYGRGIDNSTSPVTATDTTIFLNQGESFVQAQEKYLMPSYSTTNNYNGIRIIADKKIAVNSGSLLAVQDGNGRDIGMDQIAPSRLAGTKYGVIKGNGNTSREKVIVVATESGTTTLSTSNGNVTINGLGAYTILNGAYWNTVSSPSVGSAHSNMVFTSDKPVMVYHTTFGANAGNASSLNIIPPVADCIGSDSIYVANALQFGNSSKINIISKVGSTIQIEDENGNNLLTIPSSAGNNFAGSSLGTHLSTSFSIPSGVSDVFVHGDDKFSLGFFGASGVAGGAGYMSSFSLTDVEFDNSASILLNNGGELKVDLCEVNSANLGVETPGIYSDFQWYKDEVAINGATNSSLTVSTKGNYYVKATYCSFDIAATTVNVDHFGTYGNQGISALESSFDATSFDGAGNGFNVSTWVDNGKHANDATASNGPTVTNGFNSLSNGQGNAYGRNKYFSDKNYATGLNFNRNNGNYLKTNAALTPLNGTNNFSFVIVVKDDNTQNNRAIWSFSNEATAPRLIKENGGYRFVQGTRSAPSITGNINTNTNLYHVISGVYDGTAITLYADGKKGASSNSTALLSILSEMIIGGGAEGTNEFFDGLILGTSVFNIALTDAERQIVESSYALKYGISLDETNDETSLNDGDYISSFGTVIWDYSTNSGFHNQVAGIGYDECGKINQKQATSVEGDILTIGLGTLTNFNSTNTSNFTNDDSFFIWGNNNEEEDSFQVTDFGTTVNGETMQGRMKRVWKGQETGTVNQLTLKFDLSKVGNGAGGIGTNDLSKVRLLVDSDALFAFGATSIAPTTYNQTTGIVEFSHNFSSSTGFFFTLGTVDVGSAALPIELTYFDAVLVEDKVELLWETVTEINNDYFIVERSTDAENWEYVGEIEGAGNSVENLYYSLVDEKPLKGTSYYRLKQVDFDLNYTYSNIEVIENNTGNYSLTAFPNPTKNDITIDLSTVENYEIELLNNIGQKIMTNYNENSGQVKLSMEDLPEGLYFVNVKTGGTTQVLKVIKE